MMKCEIVKMPNYILNGVNSSTNFFIGLIPLKDLLTKLSNDVTKINTI